MAELSIPEKLNPNSKLDLELEVIMFGESVSYSFPSITVPKAAPLMSKVKGLNLKMENRERLLTGNNKSFSFNKYKIMEDISQNRYKLLLVLTAEKIPGDLAVNDDVAINGSGLNNVVGIVLSIKDAKRNYVYLSVNKSSKPNVQNGGTITEINKRVSVKDVRVVLPDTVIEGLVSEKPRTSAEKGNIRDIPIFAYKQFNGKNTAAIKYKLMNNDKEINLKSPPVIADVVDYIGRKTYDKSFKINDEAGQNILCFVAIARYIYDGTKWNGEWLQINSSKDVIWGRAR